LGPRSTIDDASYTFDAAGNRTAKVNDLSGGAPSNYGHGAIYELFSTAQGSNTTESYTYDPVGNRQSSLGVSSYSCNVSNDLTSSSAASYGYDNDGNTTSKTASGNTTNYSWDYENRLTSVTLPNSGRTVTFKYDPFGRRIYKSSNPGTFIYAYDGTGIVETVNASGGVLARYSQGPIIDEPLAEQQSDTTDYYDADGNGSITSLTNVTGALAQTYTFDSYGNTTNSSGSLTNFFQYNAREFDTETGLYFYRARYYDPTAGRFLREDPLRFRAGINFYAYVGNGPTNVRDPFGLDPSTWKNVWGLGEFAKDAYDKAKKAADKLICYAKGLNCLLPTFDNLNGMLQASRGDIRNTLTPQDYQNPSASQGLNNIQKCAAGNQNCKELDDCLAGVVAGGMFPAP